MIYNDVNISDFEIVRTFDESIDPIELMWHRDLETRKIISIKPSNWKIQLENELPVNMESIIKIPAGTWHRLIKGTNSLTIKIIKEYE